MNSSLLEETCSDCGGRGTTWGSSVAERCWCCLGTGRVTRSTHTPESAIPCATLPTPHPDSPTLVGPLYAAGSRTCARCVGLEAELAAEKARADKAEAALECARHECNRNADTIEGLRERVAWLEAALAAKDAALRAAKEALTEVAKGEGPFWVRGHSG